MTGFYRLLFDHWLHYWLRKADPMCLSWVLISSLDICFGSSPIDRSFLSMYAALYITLHMHTDLGCTADPCWLSILWWCLDCKCWSMILMLFFAWQHCFQWSVFSIHTCMCQVILLLSEGVHPSQYCQEYRCHPECFAQQLGFSLPAQLVRLDMW